MLKLRATPDGRIMGTFRMQDGRPNLFEEIRLLKAEVRENEPDGYFQSVRADEQGHFVFKGVRPGKYRIGRLAYQINATLIPAVYYPGVANRKDAELIEISRGE